MGPILLIVSLFEESDEYCPHCNNKYVIPAHTPYYDPAMAANDNDEDDSDTEVETATVSPPTLMGSTPEPENSNSSTI